MFFAGIFDHSTRIVVVRDVPGDVVGRDVGRQDVTRSMTMADLLRYVEDRTRVFRATYGGSVYFTQFGRLDNGICTIGAKTTGGVSYCYEDFSKGSYLGDDLTYGVLTLTYLGGTTRVCVLCFKDKGTYSFGDVFSCRDTRVGDEDTTRHTTRYTSDNTTDANGGGFSERGCCLAVAFVTSGAQNFVFFATLWWCEFR